MSQTIKVKEYQVISKYPLLCIDKFKTLKEAHEYAKLRQNYGAKEISIWRMILTLPD